MNYKNILKIIGIILIIIFVIIVITFFSRQKIIKNAFEISFLEGTDDFRGGENFQFSISPNDNWMIYEDNSENPILLNLVNGEKTVFNNTTDQDKQNLRELGFISNKCWSDDSKYCVAPIPEDNIIYATISPAIIFNLTDQSSPKLITQILLDYNDNSQPIKFTNINNGEFTCSDCSAYTDKGGNTYEGKEAHEILSHDGNKRYYVEGYNMNKATLYEEDINIGKRRKLASFTEKDPIGGDCTRISRMRLSLNQQYLAFQVQYGCNFVTYPNLYIINLENGKIFLIGKQVYYDVHWNSKSDKLYFHKCESGGCGISYIKI